MPGKYLGARWLAGWLACLFWVRKARRTIRPGTKREPKKARQDKARQVNRQRNHHDKATQCKTRQGNARPGKTKQSNARQSLGLGWLAGPLAGLACLLLAFFGCERLGDLFNQERNATQKRQGKTRQGKSTGNGIIMTIYGLDGFPNQGVGDG